jgi:hypothetical protein
VVAEEACVGPWAPDLLHGGPPAALTVRACEQVAAEGLAGEAGWGSSSPSSVADGAGLIALRACVDFLSPIPLGELEVRARVLRGGRRVALTEAVLSAAGRDVLRAHTWLLRSGTDPALDVDAAAAARAAVPSGRATGPDELPPPEPPSPASCPPALTDWTFPYAQSLEWRHVSGDPVGPGDAAAWARPRIPLMHGEDYTGLQRAVLVADSGNGISAALDWGRWTFVNVDLAVHLSRPLAGQWVLLDARTRYEPGGTGLSTSLLRDEAGHVGTGAQTLLVSPR